MIIFMENKFLLGRYHLLDLVVDKLLLVNIVKEILLVM